MSADEWLQTPVELRDPWLARTRTTLAGSIALYALFDRVMLRFTSELRAAQRNGDTSILGLDRLGRFLREQHDGENVLYYAIVRAFLGILPDARTQQLTQVTAERFGKFEAWASCGYPDFDITSGLFGSFLLTGVDVADLDRPFRLPFPAFSLTLPQQSVLDVSRVNIARVTHPDGDFNHIEIVTKAGHSATSSWHVTESVSKMLEATVGETVKGTVSDPGRFVDLTEIIHLIVNVLFYIETIGTQKQQTQIAADDSIELSNDVSLETGRGKFHRWTIGRTIKLPQKVIEVGLTNRASWKLETRFMVRGHWRNQAVGANRAYRKPVWVRPYYKGPDDLCDALQRKFSVDTSEDT